MKNNKLNMPKLGFGTWSIAEKDIDHSISAALDAGYKLIDTAQIYNNEYYIGETLKKYDRKKIFITTKVWIDNFGEKLEESALESLRRLNTDYIDLLLLHMPWRNKIILMDAIKKLVELKRIGKIKHFGVSNWSREDIEYMYNQLGYYPEVNQIIFSPLNQQREFIEWMHEKGIIVTGYSTLKPYLNKSNTDNLFLTPKQIKVIDNIGKKHKKTGAQVILRWALQEDVCMIPKSITESRIKTNFDIMDFKLIKEEMEMIREMDTSADIKVQRTAKLVEKRIKPNFRKGLLYDREFNEKQLTMKYILRKFNIFKK